MYEIIPLTQEWFPKKDCKCVREAVAVIECRPMTSFAETAESPARDLALLGVHRNGFDTCPGRQAI